jgi:hypothetical protein
VAIAFPCIVLFVPFIVSSELGAFVSVEPEAVASAKLDGLLKISCRSRIFVLYAGA